MRSNSRQPQQLRPLTIQRNYIGQASGRVLIQMGRTTVLCTCTVDPKVPPFLEGTGKGWLTAEYSMLPGSTSTRKARDRGGKVDGRTVEIQRLIGRSLRAVVDLDKLQEHTLWIDCDVLEADGGTRTASINGAFVALVDALQAHKDVFGEPRTLLKDSVAAISVGIVQGQPVLDLDYPEDRDAEVDMNLVMTGTGQFIEIQGTGEESTFSRDQLDSLLKLGTDGINEITSQQRNSLGSNWPLD